MGGSCPVPSPLPTDPVPFISNGNINFKAHDVGWLLAGIMGLIGSVASIWLIRKHLRFFYCPVQQRHIVRILFMVPIYAVSSFLSYYFYTHALYFQLVRDCYEAIVIASFFHLLLSYLASPPPTPEIPFPPPYETREERAAQIKSVFGEFKLKHWMWPLGWIKWRPKGGGEGEGLGFLWVMRVCIGQYVILRPLSTLISVIGEAMGIYCLESWSPTYLHIWTSGVVSISVTVAMYAVLQLYMPLTKELAPYSPVLKFLSVKSVVFLTFWQESVLSLFEMVGWITDHQYWSATEIAIGISAMLSCFEMMVFGFVHIKAFTYLPYRALAKPITFYMEPASPLEDLPQSFEEWTKLEASSHREQVLQTRLRPLPPTYDKHGKETPTTREDGLPILRETKMLPALWKCLKITDIFRELGEESKYVGRSVVKRDETLLTRDEIMKGAFGRDRVAPGDDTVSEKAPSITFPITPTAPTPQAKSRAPGRRHRPEASTDFSPYHHLPYDSQALEESQMYEPMLSVAPHSPTLQERRRLKQTAEEKVGMWTSWKEKTLRGLRSGGARPEVAGTFEQLARAKLVPEMAQAPRDGLGTSPHPMPQPMSRLPPSLAAVASARPSAYHDATHRYDATRQSITSPLLSPSFTDTFSAAPELSAEGVILLDPPHRLSLEGPMLYGRETPVGRSQSDGPLQAKTSGSSPRERVPAVPLTEYAAPRARRESRAAEGKRMSPPPSRPSQQNRNSFVFENY